MKYKITQHAKERMEQYQISELQVIQAVQEPDGIVMGGKNRKIAQKRLNSHVLRVIYEEHAMGWTVITVYKARRGRYDLL